MSDDRFKQARRSLLNNSADAQRQQAVPSYTEMSEDATAMVDLNSFHQEAAAQQGAPRFQPPPNYADEDDGATQMVDINAFQAPPAAAPPPAAQGGYGAVPSPQSGYGAAPAPQGGYGAPPVPQGYGSPPQAHGAPGGYNAPPAYAPPAYAPPQPQMPSPMGGPQPGYDHGESAEGSTQFVDLNALAAGQVGGGPTATGAQPIEQDQMLTRGYIFTPEAIQRYGESTLIFARTQGDMDVVLKRLWDGPPDAMPAWMRQRVSTLGKITHPKLAKMNGLFASSSGCWADLERPQGVRMTYLLQQGARPREQVAQWMKQVGEALKAVHSHSVHYANLTTDAIWIDEQTQSVMLEPFDLLSFENRGALGPFGAPEMQLPPDQRPVTPATDVYSFAMVTLTALTGAPTPQNLELLAQDKKNKALVEALRAAFVQDPTQRALATDDIIKALQGGIDKRVLIGGGAGVLLLLIIAMMAGSPAKPKPKSFVPDAPPPIDPLQLTLKKVSSDQIVEDPRLKIETSYQLNPSAEEAVAASAPSEADLESAERAREAAKRLVDEAEKLKGSARLEKHREALQKLAEATQNQREIQPGDHALMSKILEDREAREELEAQLKLVEEKLAKKTMSGTTHTYSKLRRSYPSPNTNAFFERHDKASVEVIDSPTE